jgi:hypothetical protein
LTSVLDEGRGQFQAPTSLSPEDDSPVPIGQEAGWTQENVWALWCKEKSCHAVKRTRDAQPVAVSVPAKLPQLLIKSRALSVFTKELKPHVRLSVFVLSWMQAAVLRRVDHSSKQPYRLCKTDYETEDEARAQQRAIEPMMNRWMS